MKCLEIKSLNQRITHAPEKLISTSEKFYLDQITELSEIIYSKKETHPILLISGPSGSGKTTTAHEISRMLLEKFNCKSNVISLDNYFRSNNSPNMPLDENGNIDLESPYCTDLELLQKNLLQLERGEEFMMPQFDFKKQERGGYVPFRREPGSIAILEGIHALNPLVTGECGDFATCAYISVRTRLKSESNKLLHPRLIRLMRRLCRDSLFRGRDLAAIFSFFESVSVGEDKYILPFKHRADFEIDTFMAFEVPVYKKCLQDRLKEKKDELCSNKNYENIVEFFEQILPVGEEIVPEHSLIREFIG